MKTLCSNPTTVDVIYVLLRSGTKINMLNHKGENALTIHIKHHGKGVNSDVIMLLVAAGEYVQQSPPGLQRVLGGIPEYAEQVGPSLKHLSREAVRRYILKIDPHQHLLDKVHRPGIPHLMVDYLLYSVDVEKFNF